MNRNVPIIMIIYQLLSNASRCILISNSIQRINFTEKSIYRINNSIFINQLNCNQKKNVKYHAHKLAIGIYTNEYNEFENGMEWNEIISRIHLYMFWLYLVSISIKIARYDTPLNLNVLWEKWFFCIWCWLTY